MDKEQDPKQEGHTREWQERARVVLNAKEDVEKEASPNQSPKPDEDEDVEEKSKNINKGTRDDSNY